LTSEGLKLTIDRVELHERVQGRAGDADQAALEHLAGADAARERGTDLGPAEVQRRFLHGGIVVGQARLALVKGAVGLVGRIL
jgi:hypothetical protein